MSRLRNVSTPSPLSDARTGLVAIAIMSATIGPATSGPLPQDQSASVARSRSPVIAFFAGRGKFEL
jgi:hypothetical protein